MKFIKRFIILLMIFDNIITNLLKKLFPTKYKIIGRCGKCGKCCEEIYLKMTKKQAGSVFFTSICSRWLSWLYDFYLIRIEKDRGYLVFSCKHRGEDGLCQNYFWRPPICRNYPLCDYFEKPLFIKGCSFNCK